MIGAHNTLSAYRPLNWWMRPFAFIYRCQRKDVGALIDAGVTFYDLRFAYRGNTPIGSHGIAKFRVNPLSVISEICTRVERPVIRVILEEGDYDAVRLFRTDIETAMRSFPNAKFIGGNYRPTWRRLLDLPDDDVRDNIVQLVGSMQTKWWGKAWPWLYARLHNGKHLEEAAAHPEKYYLFDYL